MEEIWTGMLAKSKQGHDKDEIFLIIKEEGEYVFLADGNLRTLEKPKKKKRKHIQVIYHRPLGEFDEQGGNYPFRNEDIKRVLKAAGKA